MTLDLPPLSFARSLDRSVLAPAGALLVDLVSRPEITAAWDDESSCAGMSVGALTRHLVVQPVRLVEVLSSGPTHLEAISLDRHYAEVPWLQEDLDGPTNVSVRARSQQLADAGPRDAVVAARQSVGRLAEVLAGAPETVMIPWQGTALATDDFLVTRLMEIVVHSDDLASSVGLPTPSFAPGALEPVVALLTNLALRRDGQDALIRSLSRPQRAPETISAF